MSDGRRNQLKLSHATGELWKAPSVETLEAEAMEKGQARFADLEVSHIQDLFTYTVCGNKVSRSMAERAFS